MVFHVFLWHGFCLLATAGKQHAFTVAPLSQWVAALTLTKAAKKVALIAVAELNNSRGLFLPVCRRYVFLLHHVASMKCVFVWILF